MLVDCQWVERDKGGSRSLPSPTCPHREGLTVGYSAYVSGYRKRSLPYNSGVLINSVRS
jgi:hypothetical protein